MAAMWRLIRAVILISCSWVQRYGVAAEKAGSVGEKAEKALAKLQATVAKSPKNWAPLADSNFTKIVHAAERPYHTMVLFTAFGAKYNCEICRLWQGLWDELAEGMRVYTPPTGELPIVFTVLDVDAGRRQFQKLEIMTIPHAWLQPATLPVSGMGVLKEWQSVDPVFGHAVNSKTMDASRIAEHIAEATGTQFRIYRDMTSLRVLAVLGAAALALVAHAVTGKPQRVLGIVRSRLLWGLVSTVFFFVGTGGYVYCIIRRPPSHSYQRLPGGKSAPTLFSQGGRSDQLLHEGLVIASLYLLMAAGVLLLIKGTRWARIPRPVRSVFALMALAGVLFLFRELLELYISKTPWYQLWGQQGGQPGILPRQVTDFFSAKIRKSDGLLRRVVRLSDAWLHEFTTVAAFKKKAKQLLWDWLLRKLRLS